MNQEITVLMKDITKVFPGVIALQNVTFSVKEAEVKGLVGENGAGKSTLIKILTGAYAPDSGEIYVFGQKINNMTPILAEQLGISAVYQNLVLADHLTVAENIMLGALPTKWGLVDKSEMNKKAEEILAQIGYRGIIKPEEKVGNLSASQQGMVAIARALSRNAKIIIFDEPTAVLTDREVKELFRVIRWLKDSGRSVIYISHRLEEIFELCDTVTVLKDGAVMGEKIVSETNQDQLVAMMVGREVRHGIFDDTREIGEEILRVENLSTKKLKNCSFSLRSGEIVGIYGLVGSGRTELSKALFGVEPIESGEVFLNGEKISLRNPRESIDLGINLIPEDRRREGIALKLSVKDNINLPVYPRITKIGFVDRKKEKEIAQTYVQLLSIKTPSLSHRVENLSGGNQQKVVVAKGLASQSRVFIMDEPTTGIDVGAKEEIYQLINNIAREGAGVIFISSYMPELMAICDRILVMRDGKIVADIERKDFDEEKILTLAIKYEAAAGGENRGK